MEVPLVLSLGEASFSAICARVSGSVSSLRQAPHLLVVTLLVVTLLVVTLLVVTLLVVVALTAGGGGLGWWWWSWLVVVVLAAGGGDLVTRAGCSCCTGLAVVASHPAAN